MRFLAVLNKDGGTLRTADIPGFSKRLEETLKAAGHFVSIEVILGRDIVAALNDAAVSRRHDVVLAGGGDGTVSAAAASLMGKKKALAVLPAGTMNLFARGLGIPLSLDKAVAAFATGEVRAVDIATANGRPFVHQFSIGMHARMVHLRSKMEFASRWGKIRASAKAAYSTLMNPPSMHVELDFGEADFVAKTTSVGITNNLFGEGTLPYAKDPSGGTLGIYVTVAHEKGELIRFLAQAARGKWRDNDQVEIREAEKVRLTIKSRRFRHQCVIDGELLKLERETVLEIHPKALNVLVPGSLTRSPHAISRRESAV